MPVELAACKSFCIAGVSFGQKLLMLECQAGVKQHGGCGRQKYVYKLVGAIREKTSGLETLRRRKTSASIQVLACFRTRTRSLRSLGLAWCRMSPASGRYSYVACYLESFGLGSVPSLAFALSLALFASVSLSLSRLLSLARLSL